LAAIGSLLAQAQRHQPTDERHDKHEQNNCARISHFLFLHAEADRLPESVSTLTE
jgi:hypothetical protein